MLKRNFCNRLKFELIILISCVKLTVKFAEKINRGGIKKSRSAMIFTKLNYCQYLLSSQINYTLTNLADHLEQISHDKINRYLKNEKLTPRLLWDNVKDVIEINHNAYLFFDDTVIDKRYAIAIETSRRQYSGNEHSIIQRIGVINCIYVNHHVGKF